MRRTKWEGTAAKAAAGLGLSLRVFWRWVAVGEETGELLPVNVPGEVPEWYERHREMGKFSHRLPDRVRAACGGMVPAAPEKSAPKEPASEVKKSENAEENVVVEVVPGGLVEELAKLEDDVAAVRAQRDSEKDATEKRRLDGVYQDKLNLLMRLQKDLPRYLEASEMYLYKPHFEAAHSEIVGSVVQTLNSRLRSGRLHALLQCGVTVDDFSRVMGEELRAVLRMLAESKFAPPMELAA